MRKTYRYRDLSFPVADTTQVDFTVAFISDVTLGKTKIYQPHLGNPTITNSGTVSIGSGTQLRGRITIVMTEVTNLGPNVTEIKIAYKLNDQLLVEHHNLKSEEENPTIILFIKFPEA
jgi:hypothetical protein